MLPSVESSPIHLTHRLLGLLNNPFRGISEKPKWRKKLKKLPLPNVRYVIFFTPRSGSSRLTHLLADAGGLSIPGECFNPNHIRKMAISLGAQGLEDYLDLLMRKRSTKGTFGCEVTSSHLYNIFFSDRRFFEFYKPTSIVFLIRENIVEQAVSLTRMKQTRVAHSTSQIGPSRKQLYFQYRPNEIRRKLSQLLSMEKRIERIIASRNFEPLRLSYETLTRHEPDTFVPLIAKHVGATCEQVQHLHSAHQKMGDGQNLEFAQRFGAENKYLLEKIQQRRLETLSALAEQKKLYFPAE